jgi:hypothetical protein
MRASLGNNLLIQPPFCSVAALVPRGLALFSPSAWPVAGAAGARKKETKKAVGVRNTDGLLEVLRLPRILGDKQKKIGARIRMRIMRFFLVPHRVKLSVTN